MAYTRQQIAGWEQLLRGFGFFAGRPSGGATLTPELVSAIREYQKAEGLPVTGVMDPATSQSMVKRLEIIGNGGVPEGADQSVIDKVRELYDQLNKRGVDVKFAIHPVAGRMPGHMNVLLAEAEIPYDALVEMDDINSDLPQTDVALVVGANDVVNPAARHDKNSPIFGMPIIDVDKAKTVIAIKRSMNPGFAGIDNELYYLDQTMMAFGDAKQVLSDVVKAISGEGAH